MKPLCLILTALATAAADQTWTGTISDSICGANHKPKTQQGKTLSDRDCALACTKDQNAKFVFITAGKAYKISNKGSFEEFAGYTVTITGELIGDTISVRRLSMTTK